MRDERFKRSETSAGDSGVELDAGPVGDANVVPCAVGRRGRDVEEVEANYGDNAYKKPQSKNKVQPHLLPFR